MIKLHWAWTSRTVWLDSINSKKETFEKKVLETSENLLFINSNWNVYYGKEKKINYTKPSWENNPHADNTSNRSA